MVSDTWVWKSGGSARTAQHRWSVVTANVNCYMLYKLDIIKVCCTKLTESPESIPMNMSNRCTIPRKHTLPLWKTQWGNNVRRNSKSLKSTHYNIIHLPNFEGLLQYSLSSIIILPLWILLKENVARPSTSVLSIHIQLYYNFKCW